MSSWMTANKRQLNDNEPEALIILNTVQATQTLVGSVVCSRLDYCKSPLSGCPQHLLDQLQKVQNAVARFVPGAKKSDIIHPMHWLQVTHHIQYKRLTICFIYISGRAPQYLFDLLQPYTRELWSSADTQTFVTPRVDTKTFGDKSFFYAGPSVWNNLPQTLHHSDSSSSFKAALKTHLYNICF